MRFASRPLLCGPEVAALIVFMVFALTFLKEKFAWTYLASFAFLAVAAYFAFAFKNS